MQKIVINTSSGFNLTHKAIMRYAELKGIKLTPYLYNYDSERWYKTHYLDNNKDLDWFIDIDSNIILMTDKICNSSFFSIYEIDRTDQALIQVVEELRDSEHMDLKIVEVPDDVKWKIEEDETGLECVREVPRCWW